MSNEDREAKEARELMEFAGEDFEELTVERLHEVRAQLDIDTVKRTHGEEPPERVVLSYPEMYELLRGYEKMLDYRAKLDELGSAR